MRFLIALALASFSLASWAPTDAEARNRSYRAKHGKPAAYHYDRRPASVGANGLCQRDTGTPTGNLNFRNRCDVEEFWARTMQRGGGRR